jgi:hypothetical protein
VASLSGTLVTNAGYSNWPRPRLRTLRIVQSLVDADGIAAF